MKDEIMFCENCDLFVRRPHRVDHYIRPLSSEDFAPSKPIRTEGA
jgi:hypothetical protein